MNEFPDSGADGFNFADTIDLDLDHATARAALGATGLQFFRDLLQAAVTGFSGGADIKPGVCSAAEPLSRVQGSLPSEAAARLGDGSDDSEFPA